MGRKPSPKTENNKAALRERKTQVRRRYRENQRRALAISDYLLLAATQQHKEATEFVKKLEEKYPNKKDIRKTAEFRNWQRTQVSLISKETTKATDEPAASKDINPPEKEMVLRIQLFQTKANETTSASSMTGEEQPGEEDLADIFDIIPSDVMDQLVKEIRSDPELEAILNDFDADPELEATMNEFEPYEEVIDEGNVSDRDIDIDIDIGVPLEEEIDKLVYTF